MQKLGLTKDMTKCESLVTANLAGMISGFLIGYGTCCLMRRFMKHRNSLRCRAKRAFKTIEDTMSL